MEIKRKFLIFLGVALGHLLLIFYLDRMAAPSLEVAGTSSIWVTFVRVSHERAPPPERAMEQEASPAPKEEGEPLPSRVSDAGAADVETSLATPKGPLRSLAVADADLTSANPVEQHTHGQIMHPRTISDEPPKQTTIMATPEGAVTPLEGARHEGYPAAPDDYQVELAQLEEAGRIVIRVLTREDGTAETAVLQRSSGLRHLDELALDAVRQWQFPAGSQWILVPVKVGLRH